MQENNQKITKELAKGKCLLFFPKTGEEAAFIQRKIFEMGFMWSDSSPVIKLVDKCVSTGMLLKGGRLYTAPSAESREIGLVCTSEQFDEKYLPLPTMRELMERFNELAARVDAIYEIVSPKTLDKPEPSPRHPKL